MKVCKLCHREFEDDLPPETNPAEELGHLFLERGDENNTEDICPDCREKEGILVLIGLGL